LHDVASENLTSKKATEDLFQGDLKKPLIHISYTSKFETLADLLERSLSNAILPLNEAIRIQELFDVSEFALSFVSLKISFTLENQNKSIKKTIQFHLCVLVTHLTNFRHNCPYHTLKNPILTKKLQFSPFLFRIYSLGKFRSLIFIIFSRYEPLQGLVKCTAVTVTSF
jgi:hypothetical protein